MERILIINLRKLGDILSTAHLIHSIKAQRPDIEISILVYKENIKAAKILKNISNIFTLSRKKIVQFKKNRIYPKAMAIELLKSELDNIQEQDWDHVINFSNEHLSCLITSYFESKNFVGLKYNTQSQIKYSNSWSLLFNDVMTEYPFTPFHFNECYHQMAGVAQWPDEIKILTDPENNKLAYENFQKIKESGRNDHSQKVKLIGIQIKSGVSEKEIPKDVIVDLIRELQDQKDFFPIVLVSPNQEDKKYINEINQYFSQNLLSVEADLKSVPSVLLNLDLLITPDTSIKHLADLVSTPVIEVSRGNAPFRKQGSINKGSLILRDHYNNINANDIIGTLYYHFGIFKKEDLLLNSGVNLYEVLSIEDFFIYFPIAGKFNSHFEISTLMSKYFVSKLLQDKQYDEILKLILDSSTKDTIYEWVNQEKEAISKIVRQLLSTIKALRTLKLQGSYQNEFVKDLDKLLELCYEKAISSIPVLLFRGKLESIEKTSFEQNIKDLEKLLFEMKNNLQLLTTSITNLTSFEFKVRKTTEERRPELSP